jgi:hypothetical protein
MRSLRELAVENHIVEKLFDHFAFARLQARAALCGLLCLLLRPARTL